MARLDMVPPSHPHLALHKCTWGQRYDPTAWHTLAARGEALCAGGPGRWQRRRGPI